jgi:transposase
VPLATVLPGANRTDMKKLADLLDAIVVELPPLVAEAERHLCLDLGYAYDESREAATTRGYTVHLPPPRNAPRPIPPPGDPTRHPARRWVVEVAHSWFNRFRRLLTRWEKKAANYLAFVHLAAVLIIYRKLRHARAPFG